MATDWHSTTAPYVSSPFEIPGIKPKSGEDELLDAARRIAQTAEPRMMMMKPAFSVYVIGNGYLVSFDGVLENSFYAGSEQELADLLVAKKVREKIAPEPTEGTTAAYRTHTKPIRQIGDQNGKHF